MRRQRQWQQPQWMDRSTVLSTLALVALVLVLALSVKSFQARQAAQAAIDRQYERDQVVQRQKRLKEQAQRAFQRHQQMDKEYPVETIWTLVGYTAENKAVFEPNGDPAGRRVFSPDWYVVQQIAVIGDRYRIVPTHYRDVKEFVASEDGGLPDEELLIAYMVGTKEQGALKEPFEVLDEEILGKRRRLTYTNSRYRANRYNEIVVIAGD